MADGREEEQGGGVHTSVGRCLTYLQWCFHPPCHRMGSDNGGVGGPGPALVMFVKQGGGGDVLRRLPVYRTNGLPKWPKGESLGMTRLYLRRDVRPSLVRAQATDRLALEPHVMKALTSTEKRKND